MQLLSYNHILPNSGKNKGMKSNARKHSSQRIRGLMERKLASSPKIISDQNQTEIENNRISFKGTLTVWSSPWRTWRYYYCKTRKRNSAKRVTEGILDAYRLFGEKSYLKSYGNTFITECHCLNNGTSQEVQSYSYGTNSSTCFRSLELQGLILPKLLLQEETGKHGINGYERLPLQQASWHIIEEITLIIFFNHILDKLNPMERSGNFWGSNEKCHYIRQEDNLGHVSYTNHVNPSADYNSLSHISLMGLGNSHNPFWWIHMYILHHSVHGHYLDNLYASGCHTIVHYASEQHQQAHKIAHLAHAIGIEPHNSDELRHDHPHKDEPNPMGYIMHLMAGHSHNPFKWLHLYLLDHGTHIFGHTGVIHGLAVDLHFEAIYFFIMHIIGLSYASHTSGDQAKATGWKVPVDMISDFKRIEKAPHVSVISAQPLPPE